MFDQLSWLKAHGHECTVILAGDDGPTVALCRSAGIAVKPFDFGVYGLRVFTLPLRVLKLALLMRRERFDVVQSHIIPSTLFARPAAWLADVPVRLEMSTSPYYMQAPSMRWIEAWTAWMETGLIPSCTLTQQLFRGAGIPESIVQPVLYYGPDASRFDPERQEPENLRAEFGLAPDTPLIGSVAIFYSKCRGGSFVPPETRHRYIKGHTDVIQAMHRVIREIPAARLVMIGCGWGPKAHETEADLRDIVRREGLEGVVLFAGWRPDTAAVYMDLDVSVQASLNENLGGTIESLLMALPTVATRVGGMVDSVVDGETGVLVAPGDPDDLARGILRLLGDPERAAALGRAGRARMLSRFTLATTMPALVELYRRQRAEARGAFRLRVGLGRLVLAALLAVPLLARVAFDLVARTYLPNRWREFSRFLGKMRGGLTAPDPAPPPPS